VAQITIELPDEMAGYLENQVTAGRSASASEFVTRVLLGYRERESIEQKVLAADMADDATEVTPEFFESLRTLVNKPSATR
jgi:Arc/MetJ-type ribon-helix-helix transcriptional regulator